MDTPISDPNEETDDNQIAQGDELPVKINTLSIDGTQPEIGDEVEVTVKGTIDRIRDDCAYVKLDTANGDPIENPPKQPEDEGSADDMMQMAQEADMSGATPGGSYG